jgi:hypothetical protein
MLNRILTQSVELPTVSSMLFSACGSVQPFDRHAQVIRRHDVVTPEYAVGRVPGQLHRHALRHACAHEVPHG